MQTPSLTVLLCPSPSSDIPRTCLSGSLTTYGKVTLQWRPSVPLPSTVPARVPLLLTGYARDGQTHLAATVMGQAEHSSGWMRTSSADVPTHLACVRVCRNRMGQAGRKVCTIYHTAHRLSGQVVHIIQPGALTLTHRIFFSIPTGIEIPPPAYSALVLTRLHPRPSPATILTTLQWHSPAPSCSYPPSSRSCARCILHRGI